MKIGIITFSSAENIGALLQAYALENFLNNELGQNAKHIEFSYRVLKGDNTASGNNKSGVIEKIESKIHGRIRRGRFKSFKKSYISFFEKHYHETIPENAENCDVYIAGSDQIWNTELNGKKTEFYLDFVKDKYKMAYSASVGRELTDDDKEYVLAALRNLDKISVREPDLLCFISKYQSSSSVTVDPVFLLDRDQWKTVEHKVNTPKRYVFCYLMEASDGIVHTLRDVAKKYDASILWVNGGGVKNVDISGRELKHIGPREFIYLIDNSCAVVTNSFHGAAFSCVLNKPLFLVEHSKRNSRLIQLAELLHQRKNIISYKYMDPIDLENKVIGESTDMLFDSIKQSKDYLKKTLQECELRVRSR